MRSVSGVRFPMNSGDAVGLVVAEGVEVAAGAVGDGPPEEVVRLEGPDEVGEERVAVGVGVVGGGEAGEDGDLPAGAAVGVGLVEGGGLVEDLEGEGRGAGGVGRGVVDEEDGAHGAPAEDPDGPEVVDVEVRGGIGRRG
ncbi:hypothetical protein CRG98_019395 [Punica granatum]|uniref:Uncharacterized protein n=1 Tax=Punica granatum TaxID=22663 RepID=A0A2I0JV56_PUNGR|nr:hypothetical protein CRG98_019395 [Punica granatum]